MMHATELRLQQVADHVGGQVSGDPQYRIDSLATLQTAGPGQLSFFANNRYLQQLKASKAGAVLVSEAHRDSVGGHAVLVDDPYLAFARISELFDWRAPVSPGVHPTAVVAEDAEVDPAAQVGPYAVIGAGSRIAAGVNIGAQAVVGARCSIGAGSRIEAGAVLYDDVRIGERCIVHSGAVLGADGFGFAPEAGRWRKICQLGGVSIGDDVEIGACTTVDRGALDDTRIDDGVKLDNQIQVAHNVEIGRDAAIAGCTGISGSTKIGERCTIGGGVGFVGHLTIAPDTHITGMSLVSKSITEAGVYSSGTTLQPYQNWKRNVVRFRQLDELARRVAKLEQLIEQNSTEGHTE